jgi:hypothetical protein
MIVLNRDRFFGGGRLGVIQNTSFQCALNTVYHNSNVGSFALICSFSGEWNYKNYEPVAEALLQTSLSRKQVVQIHDAFLEKLDQRGLDGADLSGAIELVFKEACNTGIVTRYKNDAAPLLTKPA